MHTTATILKLFILFRLLFILLLIFQMWVHMTRLEGNGQPLQGGNQLMMEMVQRGNRRINVEHKWQKIKKCLTQIHSNKIVSIKLSFSMSIQGPLLFVVKFMLLCKFFEILTYLEISKPYFNYHIINWYKCEKHNYIWY